jgi:hypothetical protein
VPEDTVLVGVIHVTNFFEKNVMVYVTKSSYDETNISDDEEGSFQRVKTNEITRLDKIFDDVKLVIDKVKSQPT